MIDRTSFTRDFTLLMDRFGRQMSEPTIAEYFRILNAELTTPEFETACSVIFRLDTYFPSPQRFIDAARGSATENGQGEWDELVRLASKGDTNLEGLSPRAVGAMRAAGGWNAIAYAEGPVALATARKRFLEAYERGLEREVRGSLPAAAPVRGLL